MNPQTGQQVKCVFRNGITVEGKVKSWDANGAELESLDSESVLIIMHPADDILMIKILLVKPEEKQIQLEQEKEKISSEIVEKINEPPSDDRDKSLAELKAELIVQDRQIIANKLKAHYPGSADLNGRTKYGIPRFIKKQST